MNYAELQHQWDTAPTVEMCRRFGETHAAYGWTRRCSRAATEEGRKAYNEGYDAETARMRAGGSKSV